MTRKPKAAAEQPMEKEDPPYVPPQPLATTARRLTDEERAKILQLHAEGKRAMEIGDAVGTTTATVSRVLRAAGATTGRGRRSTETPAPPDEQSFTRQRLVNLAVQYLLKEAIDPTEENDLRTIIEHKIAEARKVAVQLALQNL